MKKFLSLLLAGTMTLSALTSPVFAEASVEYNTSPPFPTESDMKFTDVYSFTWYVDIVREATNKLNLFSGITETSFQPNGKMTRGMFVTVLGKMAKVDTSKYKTQKFNDVDETAYYAPYANWAAEEGLLSGTGDQKFSPDDAIIREHASTILYRYATENDLNLTEYDKTAAKFDDIGGLPELSKTSINKLYAATVISGQSESSFAPKKEITRAEAASLFVSSYYILNDVEETVNVYHKHSNSEPNNANPLCKITFPGYWHGRYVPLSSNEPLKQELNDNLHILEVTSNCYLLTNRPILFTLCTAKDDGEQIKKFLDDDGELKSEYKLINRVKDEDGDIYRIILSMPDKTFPNREYTMLETNFQDVIDSIEYTSGVEVLS